MRALFVACGAVGIAILRDACAEDAPAKPEETIHFVSQWGGQGAAPGQFDLPVDIAFTPSDKIYVTEHYNDRVQKFDADGKFIAQFPTLPNPGGLALDNAGNLYASHFAASLRGAEKPGADHFVCVYAPDGRQIRKWGTKGAGDGEFDCPGGIAIDGDGRVYVADQTNHRVQVFDAAGAFLFKWGAYGNEPGQFGGMSSANSRTGGPQFITVDREGNVWTTEGTNCRIQKFSPEGKLLLHWGSADDKPGALGGTFAPLRHIGASLRGPISLRFDVQGLLWITAVSGRVQQFAPDGTFIKGIVADQGEEQGQFLAPHGLAFNSRGDLYVLDSYNHRIQRFAVSAAEQVTPSP